MFNNRHAQNIFLYSIIVVSTSVGFFLIGREFREINNTMPDINKEVYNSKINKFDDQIEKLNTNMKQNIIFDDNTQVENLEIIQNKPDVITIEKKLDINNLYKACQSYEEKLKDLDNYINEYLKNVQNNIVKEIAINEPDMETLKIAESLKPKISNNDFKTDPNPLFDKILKFSKKYEALNANLINYNTQVLELIDIIDKYDFKNEIKEFPKIIEKSSGIQNLIEEVKEKNIKSIKISEDNFKKLDIELIEKKINDINIKIKNS